MMFSIYDLYCINSIDCFFVQRKLLHLRLLTIFYFIFHILLVGRHSILIYTQFQAKIMQVTRTSSVTVSQTIQVITILCKVIYCSHEEGKKLQLELVL